MLLKYTFLVLLAAVLHASWNFIIKIQGERLACIAWLSIFASVCWMPLLTLFPPLSKAAIPWLILTAIPHLLYKIALARAYDHGDFSQVYPIARGSAPLLVTLLAIPVAGEWLGPFDLFSLLLIICGVLLLSSNEKKIVFSKGVLWAVGTGVCIALYTVADGVGSRATIHPLTFAGWQCVIDGLSIFVVALIWRPGKLKATVVGQWPKLLIGGILSGGAYAVIIYVMSQTKIGPVSALRETSVLWATLMGTFFLKERFGKRRIFATLVILCGVICLQLTSA